MPRSEVDTKRLVKKGAPRVSLGDVKDRLIETIEHHSVEYRLDIGSTQFHVRVGFFDVIKAGSEHDRSATLNIEILDAAIPTEDEYDAIKLFVARHLKLAQGIKVFDAPHDPKTAHHKPKKEIQVVCP